MLPEAAFRRIKRALLSIACLFASVARIFGQEGGAFGLSAKGLADLLAGQDIAPVLSLAGPSLDDTGAFGPSAYYYLARWLDSRGAAAAATLPPVDSSTALPSLEAAARSRLLYRMAYKRGSGIACREGGLALIDHLDTAGLMDELLSFSKEFAASQGAEWKAERPRLDALDALGRGAEAMALVARLRRAYPAEATKDADALSYFHAAAEMRSGGKSWTKELRRILLERPASIWTERAYALTGKDAKAHALFSAEELHALAMRDAVNRKDFTLAYKEALLGPGAAMGRSASQAMIADAGKAFLYSGKLEEGEPLFTAVGWTARFYKARFARAQKRWEEAAGLFNRAVVDAPTQVDADAARWYAADCAYRGALAAASGPSGEAVPMSDQAKSMAEAAARTEALDTLVSISTAWHDPATFSDLASGLFRDALHNRDWRLVEAMAERLAPKLAPEMAARIAYAAARAFELDLAYGSGTGPGGLETEARSAAAAIRFAAIADDQGAPLYYRALSAWRAGIEPTFVSDASLQHDTVPGAPVTIGATEAFVTGLAGFGLGDIALAEAKARRTALSDDALRRLAAYLSSIGRPDCAMRLVVELSSRPGYEPRRSDYELLYPRPYLEEIRSIRLGPMLDEGLALGLLRSESFFKADAVSWAGAIGLSQLMPATAADQAKALRLSSYDLRSPKDNLTLGLAHFASLLDRTEGRALRAMIAYNAGWGRLRTWIAESGDLPDDLMVEAIGIEETRQYCRNILQASVLYGELYYGRTVAETAREIVEGRGGAGRKGDQY